MPGFDEPRFAVADFDASGRRGEVRRAGVHVAGHVERPALTPAQRLFEIEAAQGAVDHFQRAVAVGARHDVGGRAPARADRRFQRTLAGQIPVPEVRKQRAEIGVVHGEREPGLAIALAVLDQDFSTERGVREARLQ